MLRQARTVVLGVLGITLSALSALAVPPADSNFQKVILDQNVNNSLLEPLDLEVLPDGRVIYVTRQGQFKIWRPSSGTAVVAGQLTVSTQFEDGLTGIVKDPSFATNGWIYVYYMSATAEVARVVRLTVSGDTVNTAAQTLIIEWPAQRAQGHTGGGMAFDGAGNLYIAVGENKAATGYSNTGSLDTAGNSNDLRGKILRVRPGASGGYSVPTGNMFPPGTARTKPEIYAMGFRNPYRIHYDTRRNRLLVGNVGPDAAADGAEGPRGHDEWDWIDSPGFYGWPMCIANNLAYAGYNCAAPVNNSAGNTGLVNLPAARPAWIWYHGSSTPAFPQLGTGGRCAFAGPIYTYNAGSTSTIKFPAYFDYSIFLVEFSRSRFWETRVDAGGNIQEINALFQSFPWNAPIAADFGPDGALYVLEYAGFFNGSPDTRLARVEYRGAQTGLSPVARASSTPDSGPTPLNVAFSSAGSNDPDGGPITYAWDFDGNGTTDSTAANPSFTYNSAGSFNARLTVRDNTGLTATITIPIVAGNTRPTVNITAPPEGGFVSWSGSINYSIAVNDPEDGTINCTRVQLQPALGHDTHAHPAQQIAGCSGSLTVPANTGHTDLENTYLILSANYTDLGGALALSNSNVKSYQTKRRQGEHFNTGGGVSITGTGDPAGGLSEVSSIDPNDWIAYTPMNFQGISQVRYRVGSITGGTIEVRLDSTTGTLLSTATVPASQGYMDVTSNLGGSSGTHTVYFVFKGSGTDLFRVNWIDFIGNGVSTGGTSPTPPPTGCMATNNIAAGRIGTASSALSSANQAFDGSATTRWESAHGVDPQWIQVDLGALQNICRVVLNWEAAYATAYQIQVSNNGSTWTNVFSTTTGNGGIDDLTGLATAGRYVRMNGTARATGYGYSLFEFEVYAGSGSGGPTPTATPTSRTTPTATSRTAPTPTATPSGSATLLSQGRPVVVSSTENAGTPGNAAVDGNLTGTRWSSAASDPQWIYVDLGSTVNVSRVVLTWEAAYATAYQIQTSPNASTWTTIYSTTTGNGATDDLTGLSGSGRYVRMNGTARATVWGYSLWELQVYGTTGSATPTATARPTATATSRGTATATTRATPTSTTAPTPTTPRATPTNPPVTNRVLVFSRTLGFRHDSIPAGISMIQALGSANGFAVDTTEDPNAFTDANLAQYGAVIWLSTTGDVLDPAQQAAFTRFIQGNKGYVGIHSASDTEYTWPWYGVLVGGYFNGHPMGGQQTFTIQDTAHPSTTGMATTWIRSEAEWYNFNPNPRTNSHILVVLNEPPGTTVGMGADHPMSWCKPYDGGRSWYTGMGHNMEAYSEPQFRQHVLGGIRWALGAVSGNCGSAAPTPTPRTRPTPTPTGGGSCGGANLALFRTATASSQVGGNTAGVAFDGDAGTRWESTQGVDPQWLRVDLGSTQSLCRVVLNWEAAYASAYQIQTSNDGSSWSNIYTTTTSTGGLQILSVSGSGRYLRMNGTARGTGYGYSLWEMEAYSGVSATPTPTPRSAATPTATTPPRATPTSGTATLLSQGRPVTVSSTENAGTPGSAAVDGNLTGTRWASAFSDPQWISVDLGQTRSISRVVLTWEAAYGTAYQIQTSPDNANWTTIFTTTTGNGATDDLTGLSGSGRYVRMYGTARATGWGYSLWEYQVYGQ
jgi:glucose/arabinose dehydrogenase/type 1 glutamine amidotransferase